MAASGNQNLTPGKFGKFSFITLFRKTATWHCSETGHCKKSFQDELITKSSNESSIRNSYDMIRGA